MSKNYFSFIWPNSHSVVQGLVVHTQRRTTVGMTPLDE
jgi:hypothetical protein